MKVELKVGKDWNDLPKHVLLINDKQMEYIQDLSDCPEDAHIGRDLIDGNDIIHYIRLGYEAGLLKEGLELIETKLNEDEY